MSVKWTGVFPAITTKFKSDYSLDLVAIEKHCHAMLAAGVHGIIVTGSLGENGVLSFEEKQEVLKVAVAVSQGCRSTRSSRRDRARARGRGGNHDRDCMPLC